ncbi:hypothetical protein DB88DRAFT_488504 [Papiliotrema laurentii]|uniref:Phospholipid/glycerol acyltransferase domain-containing protein n=1 Tax=Papiliotrema laurentii TaxID=5418 RepID=A0AAD9FPM8_PAPLA|nr:hypothetical protein DB88DRAFT_488504 [Papiliotrema laurentii]
MEKYSKWRDPATGIQPFLPPVPPNSVSPIFVAILAPFGLAHGILRAVLLAVLALLHVLLDFAAYIFYPIPPLYRAVQGVFTYLTCRLALCVLGYWWIERETVSPKRGLKGIAQIADRSPRQGDLILSNHTSYIDVLLLSALYNPTFLLPVFSALPAVPTTQPKYGRSTGTGSANISTAPLPQPPALGYVKVPFWEMMARTGSLPPTAAVLPVGAYKTLKEARRKEPRPVVLFAEGTTGNGRAILRFGEGVLEEGDVGGDQNGQVWVKYLKYSTPTPFASTATCPFPSPLTHLLSFIQTPTPFPSRSVTERTLHPSASPSSPSFLPGEILRDTPGGLEAAGPGGKGAWREACSISLAETGRTRRVRIGWVEKEGFLEYSATKRR